MNGEESKKPMSITNKIINIFVSPREAFESIDQKPTWLVPFIIIVIFMLFMMYMTLDVQLSDQTKVLETMDLPAEQIEAAQSQMNSPWRYLGFIFGPVGMLIVNVIIAALLLLAANLMIGDRDVSFKKIFSLIMWSGIIGVIQMLLTTFLALQKGTMIGISMDLSALLPTIPFGETKPIMHRLLARLDLFVIWQMILWVIGLSVMYKAEIKKAIAPVLTLWILWVIIAVGLGPVIGKFVPGM